MQKFYYKDKRIDEIIASTTPIIQRPLDLPIPTEQPDEIKITFKDEYNHEITLRPYKPENLSKPNQEKLNKYVWNLLHILSIKIKDEIFDSVRQEFLDIIHYICTHNICGICSMSARVYFKALKFLKINTKQELIKFLLDFHNFVNQEVVDRHKEEFKQYEKMVKDNIKNLDNENCAIFEESIDIYKQELIKKKMWNDPYVFTIDDLFETYRNMDLNIVIQDFEKFYEEYNKYVLATKKDVEYVAEWLHKNDIFV